MAGGPQRDRGKTKTWDKVIVDRKGELSEWVDLLKKVHERRIMILAFPNNHFPTWRRDRRIVPQPLGDDALQKSMIPRQIEEQKLALRLAIRYS
jgi:hypothetical protein